MKLFEDLCSKKIIVEVLDGSKIPLIFLLSFTESIEKISHWNQKLENKKFHHEACAKFF